jgi:uncharacterized protein
VIARQHVAGAAGAFTRIAHLPVPLSDGTILAARAWLPTGAAEAPVPAILESQPYRKSDGTATRDERLGSWFACRGFAFVRLDIRGSGDATGTIEDEYSAIEQRDNAEVIAWLARREWCSGRVGMVGVSWSGFSGLQAAALAPPALGGVIAMHSSDDRYADDVHYHGGCVLALDMIQWASSIRAYLAQPPDPEVAGEAWRTAWLERLRGTPAFIETWLTHQRRDDYWRQGSVCEDYAAIRCPVFAVGGWADGYRDAVLRLVEHLPGQARGLIGPWGHTWPDLGAPGPAVGFMQECERFFDYALRDADNGWDRGPALLAWMQDAVAPAGTYAVRPGRWVAEPSWPSPNVSTRSFGVAGDALVVDPRDAAGAGGVRRIRGLQCTGLEGGVWCGDGTPGDSATDQRPEDGASICFDSPPLPEPLELLGHARAVLVLEANRPAALAVARLCDVAPDGASTLITRGLLNLTHREGHDRVVAVEPGVAMTVAIPMQSTSYAVPAGHRLRLAVSPTYWPWAWPSPEPVTLAVHAGGASRLELPVRRRDAAGDAGAAPAGDPEWSLGEPDPQAAICDPAFGEDRSGAGGGRHLRRDLARGEVDVEFDWTGDSRTLLKLEPVTEIYERNVTRYRIAEGDPLSASAETEVAVGIERDGWRIHVEVVGRMTADREHFTVTTDLRAYEGDEHVFADVTEAVVPRDGV